MLHVYVYTCTHAYVEFHVYVYACTHACVDWYGLEIVRRRDHAGARQNMRVRIPSQLVQSGCMRSSVYCFHNTEMGRDYIFNETIQSTFSPCDRFDGDISCDIAECIDIELLDDMDVEGLQQFEIMITSVSLGTVSMTSSSTVIFLEDTIGGCA